MKSLDDIKVVSPVLSGAVVERLDGNSATDNNIIASVIDSTVHQSTAESIASQNRILGMIAEDQARRSSDARSMETQKMELIGRLAGGVAHDFNNILVVIQNYAELIGQGVNRDEILSGYIDEIKKGVDRASSLVRQLLACARKQVVSPVVLDLSVAINDRIPSLHSLVGGQIELEWQPGPGKYCVNIDPAQVDQLLTNLVVNAREAIVDNGKIKLQIDCVTVTATDLPTYSACTSGNYVKLSMSDSGKGMDEETQRHLFEPFFTAKGVDRGTGLGLAPVYGIVTQNQGFIQVHTQVDVGTTLEIFLPNDNMDEGLNS
jgi:signal transduction histidine kinase